MLNFLQRAFRHLNGSVQVNEDLIECHRLLQLSITAARRDWAQENGDVLRAFLRAQAAASKWLNNPANKDEAAQILAEATKSSLASALYTYEQFVTRAHAYPDDGCIQRSGMENLLALLRETGQIEDASTNLDTLMDRQWCPS